MLRISITLSPSISRYRPTQRFIDMYCSNRALNRPTRMGRYQVSISAGETAALRILMTSSVNADKYTVTTLKQATDDSSSTISLFDMETTRSIERWKPRTRLQGIITQGTIIHIKSFDCTQAQQHREITIQLSHKSEDLFPIRIGVTHACTPRYMKLKSYAE